MCDQRFGLLGIGNELLSGKVVDANLNTWIRGLRDRGMRVLLAGMAPDVRPLLTETIRFYHEHCDQVLLSGGIGPTHDDMTLPAVAEALGRELVREPYLEAAIRKYYGDRCNADLLRMAEVPEGTELLYKDELLVPLYRVDGIYIFPGDPKLMGRKFERWLEDLDCAEFFLKRIFTSFDEGEIASPLAALESSHEGLEVGSYPRYDGVDYSVMITLQARSRALVEIAASSLMEGAFREGVLRVEDEHFGAANSTESNELGAAGSPPEANEAKALNQGFRSGA